MVLARNSISSSRSVQSLGMFCPPISQENSHRNRNSKKTQDGSGSTAKTAAMADRKSTRLNSSHVRISYAVFCLKKKKKNTKKIKLRKKHTHIIQKHTKSAPSRT